MSESPPTWLQPLDAPLPPEIAGSRHGWFTRYRAYPVFSAPWVRGRVRALGVVLLLGLAVVLLPLTLGPMRDVPLGGLVQLVVQLFAPLLLGPLLGLWVRRRGWPAPREGLALLAALVAVVAALLAFHAWGAEPLKQRVAELAGHVDEQGRRRRVVMAIGVQITSPEAAASSPLACPPGENCREPGPMSQATNAAFSVLASFWLGGGAALWGWRRERAALTALAQARELSLAQARRREAEMRLSVLAAQVEPHFLFNSLAGVRSAISTDPSRASLMIDHLVDYLRAAIPRLRSDGGAQATLGSQLDIVRAYLALMAARMPRLQFRIDAPAELLGAPCPPLMLISLAENAVKHGAEPKMGPVHIEVQARRLPDGALELCVADDGAGFGAQTGGTGLGLANIRERLQQMFDGRATLSLKARPEGGVAATITLPPEAQP